MTKRMISARIGVIVEREAKKEAKRRGITLSKLVEVSLIHEMNKNDNHGLISELREVRDFITDKIESHSVVSDNEIIIKDNDYYLNELISIHKERGRLSPGIVERYSTLMGLSNTELYGLLEQNIDNMIIE